MDYPIDPYLAMMRQALATSLAPRDEEGERVAHLVRRVLSQMLSRSSALPRLQRQAMQELDGRLDELCVLLRTIESGMVLTGELVLHARVAPNYPLLEANLQRAVGVLAANPSEAGHKLLRDIAQILFRLQQGLHEAALAHDITGGPASAAELSPGETHQQALQAYLRQRFAEPDLIIFGLNTVTGGGSKKTLILKLRHVEYLPATIVVRADQGAGIVESTVVDEYRLIEVLHAEGVPVPRPFALEMDASIIGGAFIVVAHIDGRIIGDQLDIHEPSRSFGIDLARALGRLHRISPQRFGDGVPGATTPTLQRLGVDIGKFEQVWRNSGQVSAALEMAYDWLRKHMHFAEGRRSLVHCDVACHNLLAKDGKLAAMLDWETAIIGNPTHDLAYCHNMVAQMMPWNEFLAEYQNAGGKAPGEAEFDFYRLWTICWRMSFVYVAQSFFHSGFSSSPTLAYGARFLHQRCEHELHKVLNDLFQRY